MTPTRATLAAEREWVEDHRKWVDSGDPCPRCCELEVRLTPWGVECWSCGWRPS